MPFLTYNGLIRSQLRDGFIGGGWQIEPSRSADTPLRAWRDHERATLIVQLDPHLSVWSAQGDPGLLADWIGQARQIYAACVPRRASEI